MILLTRRVWHPNMERLQDSGNETNENSNTQERRRENVCGRVYLNIGKGINLNIGNGIKQPHKNKLCIYYAFGVKFSGTSG